MKTTLEKKLYKNLIITILIVIISIAISIALLAGIVNQLASLKRGKVEIAVQIHNINVKINSKKFFLKDIFLNYGNRKKFKQLYTAYKREKLGLNNYMKSVERKINVLQPKDKKIFGDMYLNLYKIIKKNNSTEDEIISFVKNSEYQNALKLYKITYKDEDNNLQEVLNSFYKITKNRTDQIEAAAKSKYLFILLINILTFFIFIFIAFRVILNISGNIRYLHQSAVRLKKGDLESPISVDTEDEISDLAVALDRMRQSLLKSKRLLDRYNR